MMKILDFLIIFFVLTCFIFLSIYKIDLHGLYEDEAFRAMPALEILHNKVFLPNLYSFDIFSRHFSVMLSPFQGAFNSYILVPISAIFGLSVKAIRISQVFFAAIGVLLTFILCRKLFGKKNNKEKINSNLKQAYIL